MGKKLKGKDLIQIGFPDNNNINRTLGKINKHLKRSTKEALLTEASAVLRDPNSYIHHELWRDLAKTVIEIPKKLETIALHPVCAPYNIFGENEIDPQAIDQLKEALKLPIATKGALMPDAHLGYGIPIGGVLATDNAIIPYAVGVDIACSMQLSIYPIKSNHLQGKHQQLVKILKEHTKFGRYERHTIKREHAVMEDPLFSSIPLLKKLQGKAYQQLGTSGSGNHFVEFGEVSIEEEDNPWNIAPGVYMGLLSHSGSRGLGATIANTYKEIAIQQCPLPKQVQQLAWMDIHSPEGQEYWLAMQLAGEYARACHEDIHYRIGKLLGEKAFAKVYNKHNFAWKETINGKENIVHRKGATPAGKDVLGIIPGSMTAPGYIVKGLGNKDSLHSASHGAGRKHSRRKCKAKFTKSDLKQQLKQHNVTLIGAGVDEAPMAYKNIKTVLNNQKELVEIIGKFQPKIVRMDKE